MNFKDRIKYLRKELGLTQEEFAEKIGFTRTAVSAWEIGRNEPSNNDTIKLADFFDVSLDYLLGRTDIRNAEKMLLNSKLNPEFFNYYNNLNKLGRQKVLDNMKDWSKISEYTEKDDKKIKSGNA